MSISDKLTAIEKRNWFPGALWVLRIVVGGVFVMSGLVKALDLWGFVFKIEDYLAVWQIPQPRSIAVMGGLMISAAEFVFGLLLAMGCYKRLSVWALSLMMIFWLPLTFYTWVANPVADCGCFGDFWVISNFWTFVKNLILSGLLIILLRYNTKLEQGLYQPAIQWIVGAWLSLYIIIIALYGYNIQPMADFRPYPVGSQLLSDTDLGQVDTDYEGEEDEDETSNMSFVYEKDGVREEFGIDNLPDSTWTFVERREPQTAESVEGAAFTVYDSDGEDVTEDAIKRDGQELLLIIPEANRFDISYSSFLNDLQQWCLNNSVEMVCLIGDEGGIAPWQDLSMASYPIYTVEDTKLKELSRGTMSIVILDNGVVDAKFTLSSIKGEILDEAPSGKEFLTTITPHPQRSFRILTAVFAGFLLMLFLFQSLILSVSRRIKRKYQKKEVTLQSETNSNDDVSKTENNNINSIKS